MAAVWMAAAAGAQLVGGIMGSRKAKEAGKAQAKAYMATAMEDLRRIKIQHKETESLTLARQGTTGVRLFGGTPQLYRREMETEFAKQENQFLAAAYAQAKAIKKGGSNAGAQSMMQGVVGALSSWGQAAAMS